MKEIKKKFKKKKNNIMNKTKNIIKNIIIIINNRYIKKSSVNFVINNYRKSIWEDINNLINVKKNKKNCSRVNKDHRNDYDNIIS